MLYLLSTTGKGSLLTGLEGQLLNYNRSPIFILFEISTGITIAALLAVLAVMFVSGRGDPNDHTGQFSQEVGLRLGTLGLHASVHDAKQTRVPPHVLDHLCRMQELEAWMSGGSQL